MQPIEKQRALVSRHVSAASVDTNASAIAESTISLGLSRFPEPPSSIPSTPIGTNFYGNSPASSLRSFARPSAPPVVPLRNFRPQDKQSNLATSSIPSTSSKPSFKANAPPFDPAPIFLWLSHYFCIRLARWRIQHRCRCYRRPTAAYFIYYIPSTRKPAIKKVKAGFLRHGCLQWYLGNDIPTSCWQPTRPTRAPGHHLVPIHHLRIECPVILRRCIPSKITRPQSQRQVLRGCIQGLGSL